jgi:hypothetical protein
MQFLRRSKNSIILKTIALFSSLECLRMRQKLEN